jgi:hypothetical protein
MSVAKTVGNVEPQLLWLEIEDEDGGVWKYHKRGPAPSGAVCHVSHQWHGGSQIRAALARDAKGQAILRQDEPGLPKKIVVDYCQPNPPSPFPVVSSWNALLEYEQE